MLLRVVAAGLLLTFISPVIAEEAKTVGVPAPGNKVLRQQPPQPISEYSVQPVNGVTPDRPAAEAKHALLQQKLRESEQLQNEIRQLQAELGSAQQFSVRVQMLEVSLTKLRRLKADFASEGGTETIAINDVIGLQKAITGGGITAPYQPVRAANANNANGFVEWLKQNNVAKELANPTLIVANGHPASLWSGGAVPVPASVDPAGAVEIQRTGTKMDLVVVARDNHRVRIEIRGSVRELDDAHSITVNGAKVPAMKVRQFNTAVEGTIGQAIVLSGLVEKRIESSKTQAGIRDEINEIALVVIVVPELVETTVQAKPRIGDTKQQRIRTGDVVTVIFEQERIAVQVVKIRPDGDLVIEGRREELVDETVIRRKLTGAIRPESIDLESRTIRSDQVAELRVEKLTNSLTTPDSKLP